MRLSYAFPPPPSDKMDARGQSWEHDKKNFDGFILYSKRVKVAENEYVPIGSKEEKKNNIYKDKHKLGMI